jgi:hypothetical protein
VCARVCVCVCVCACVCMCVLFERERERERGVRNKNQREKKHTWNSVRGNASSSHYVTSSYILCHIIIHTMSHHHTIIQPGIRCGGTHQAAIMSHHHTYYVTSSYILCHIIMHTMSHHHTYYVTSSYHHTTWNSVRGNPSSSHPLAMTGADVSSSATISSCV